MTRAISLRARLILIILPPILFVAVLAGLWQLNGARQTAEQVFNKSLLAVAVAVANDVAISGGDALSVRTRDILASTSGGLVFYHVYAPDGVIVAGYATPPVGIDRTGEDATDPTYFTARYLGQEVSGVRLQTQTEIEGLAGLYTTTVWQDSAVRSAFMRDLVRPSLIVSSAILLALGVIVWFGVRLGLRPLIDLEHAIGRRSSGDLSPIKRAVPQEVSGVVGTLNSLFGQVSRSMQAQSDFIGNAAHQLRNPIAGVLALAEAVVSTKDPDQARARSTDLLKAAREAAGLSQKLLMLERAQSLSQSIMSEDLEIVGALKDWITPDPRFDAQGVLLELNLPEVPVDIRADPVLLREAFVNLIDNALAHGGPGLTRIALAMTDAPGHVDIAVTDDGRGVPNRDIDRVRERFVQLGETSTTGLGLSIVSAIIEGHDGQFALSSGGAGLTATITLPKVAGL